MAETTPNKDGQLKRSHIEEGDTPGKPTRSSRKVLFTPPPVQSSKSPGWTDAELSACVFFCAEKQNNTGVMWPAMRANSPFWDEAAHYIAKVADIQIRSAASVRAKISKQFSKCATYEAALAQIKPNASSHAQLSVDTITSLIKSLLSQIDVEQRYSVLDSVFYAEAEKIKIDSNPTKFISKSISAMSRLQKSGKPNSLYKFAHVLATERMHLNRMPWGLLQYQIDFFNATNNQQIHPSDDYLSFLQTLDAEFPCRLMRLFTGPMWSGMDKADQCDPMKARVNIAGVSRSSLTRKVKELPFTDTPAVQYEALKSLTKGERYWIKLDGTDIKGALQESTTGIWNGDEDLMDGSRDALRTEFEETKKLITVSKDSSHIQPLKIIFEESLLFLKDGLKKASEKYSKVTGSTSPNQESLKQAAWECVEFTSLVTQCQNITTSITLLCSGTGESSKHQLKKMKEEWLDFVSKLYKKKRRMATHILVIMISNEKRCSKPYAVPVQFLPYISIRDQHLRDLISEVKSAMTANGLVVVGTVTDGEFHTLRTRGEKRAVHIWQLVHDSRQAVMHKSEDTLTRMLTISYYGPEGPVAQLPNNIVPGNILHQISLLTQQHGWANAVDTVRNGLVPPGYEPFPFRRFTPETLLDKLRSIVASYLYRREVQSWSSQGIDFQTHLYVAEKDPVTGGKFYDRGDHCHILKRIATSTRAGKYQALDMLRFDEALMDRQTGLTHAALVGLRKQSVVDAEKLLSFAMRNFMATRNYAIEAAYIHAVASWHEASDGRGISQLQRCRSNYGMLNYLLDELMPWHSESYNFSLLDINRPMDNIRGLTYQTFIEITANIESQEDRRCDNYIIGFEENPRSGTTDDVEAFFSLVRRHLGGTFTLREFRFKWRQLVCEFVKRISHDLPFWVWTLNERYVADYGSFDDGIINVHPREDHAYHHEENQHAPRLHRVAHCAREDASIVVPGRAFLPVRNRTHLRQRLYRPEAALPPVPMVALNLALGIQ